MVRKAVLSQDKQLRFALERYWGKPDGRIALVIGCNPSTADGLKDDPTSRWWNAWFRNYGFNGYVAVNLYPFRTSSPADCKALADWDNNGPDWHARDLIQSNLEYIVTLAKSLSQVFVCWGAIAWDQNWIDFVVEAIQEGPEPWPDLWCWGTTKNGAPKHPLARGKHRILVDQKPQIWRPGTMSDSQTCASMQVKH